ncbi:hypothetical protein L3Q82_018960, partial [Scortum barcoo]
MTATRGQTQDILEGQHFTEYPGELQIKRDLEGAAGVLGDGLEIVGLTSTHSLGSGTQLLERGWTLHYWSCPGKRRLRTEVDSSISQAKVTEVVRKLLGGKVLGVLCEYGVRGPLLRAVRSLYDRSRSLVSHCRQISKRSQSPEGVQFGNHRISSQLFADGVVLLVSSSQDLQHVLGRFAAECEVAGMRISTSKSEAMVHNRKRVACPLRVGGEILPQMEEFKYLRVLFMSEGKMEREIDSCLWNLTPHRGWDLTFITTKSAEEKEMDRYLSTMNCDGREQVFKRGLCLMSFFCPHS